MPRREDEHLERIHIRLYKRDVERLEALYGATIGISRAIRVIVRAKLNHIEARQQSMIDKEETDAIAVD